MNNSPHTESGKKAGGRETGNAGKLNYIVEWWEQDSLDMDDNRHLLFVYEKGEEDFPVKEENAGELNNLLAALDLPNGRDLAVSPEFHVQFCSRILYPPEWDGEEYFEPAGKNAWTGRLRAWMGTVKMEKRRDLP